MIINPKNFFKLSESILNHMINIHDILNKSFYVKCISIFFPFFHFNTLHWKYIKIYMTSLVFEIKIGYTMFTILINF